ncbi:hypothetical protein ONZ45_g15049 [Pleurotus djamor]|nr:hypothetical protein ONZ45_g15049 [Pleurotus djamor]
MVFYAYISEVGDSLANNDAVMRGLLAFADSATADEWWRAVSTSPNDFLTKAIKRINSEMYTHDTHLFNTYYFFEDPRLKDIASKFRGRLIITWLNDRAGRGQNIFLNKVEHAEHVSGDWFYIRSTSDRSIFWHYDINSKRIKTSKTDRTMFRVQGTDVENKTILIRSDNVSLTAYPDSKVQIDGTGSLLVGSDYWSFEFGHFASGQFVAGDYSLYLFDDDDENSSSKKPGWELVN